MIVQADTGGAPATEPAPASSRDIQNGLDALILQTLDSYPDDSDKAPGDPAPEARPAPEPETKAEPEKKPDPKEEIPESEDEDGEETPEPAKEGEPPKVSNWQRLKQKHADDLAALKKDHEEKLAALQKEKMTQEERLKATEALKEKTEATARELEQQIVEAYDAPYNVKSDPEAAPVLFAKDREVKKVVRAIAQATSKLSSDKSTHDRLAASANIFVDLANEMMEKGGPDEYYVNLLMEKLKPMGIYPDETKAEKAIEYIQAGLPSMEEVKSLNQTLEYLERKNSPTHTRDQSARHEAARREIARAADVPEDAKEGDEAVLASILKADPEMKTRLEQEKDRISAAIFGPPPGKATPGKIKASTQALRETAMKTAHIPILMTEVRARGEKITTLETRIKELETRIAEQASAVPRPAGTAAATPAPSRKAPVQERLADALGVPSF